MSLLVVLKDEERGVVRFWSFDGNRKIYVAELILPLSSFFGSFTEIQRKDLYVSEKRNFMSINITFCSCTSLLQKNQLLFNVYRKKLLVHRTPHELPASHWEEVGTRTLQLKMSANNKSRSRIRYVRRLVSIQVTPIFEHKGLLCSNLFEDQCQLPKKKS